MTTNKLILIIEDDKSMRWVLEKSLTKEGYRILVAHDGQTGFDQALNNSPDLVILDVLLPDMSGLKLLKELKASRPNLPRSEEHTSELQSH